MPVAIGSNGFPLAVNPPVFATTPTRVTSRQNERMIRARFDNQFTTDENRQLWALSDAMSVDASANWMVRRTLRMRARYAYHNNPFVMGAANRLGKFVIGGGPKLHLATGDKDANAQVASAFNLWFRRVDGPRKLQVSRTARFYNGEGFNLLRTNPRVKHAVKLDLFEVEADQVSSPLFGIYPAQYPDQYFDGITLDPWGNPDVYHVLRQHPGAFGAFTLLGSEFDAWPAQYVLHDFAKIRPAQQRGIPEVTPALQDFEEIRRYAKSVLAASETASDNAGFIYTDAPADGEADNLDSGFGSDTDYVNIKRRQMGVLPSGWKAAQMKAEQPLTQYPEYMLAKLMEVSQTLDMPLFILTGDARLANMSSAYVATQSFMNSVKDDRELGYGPLMDQVWEEWILEARRIPGLIPASVPDDPPKEWRWPKVINHADPQKNAMADNQRLKNGESPASVYADAGASWDDNAESAARCYGVTVEEYKAAFFQSTFASKGTPPPSTLADDGTGPDPSQPATDEAAE